MAIMYLLLWLSNHSGGQSGHDEILALKLKLTLKVKSINDKTIGILIKVLHFWPRIW